MPEAVHAPRPNDTGDPAGTVTPARSGGPTSHGLDDFPFILRSHVDAETIARARLIAAGWNVAPHEVMLSLGWIPVADYVMHLAAELGVPSAFGPGSGSVGGTPIPIDATAAPPTTIAAQVATARSAGQQVILTSILRPDLTDSHTARQRRVRRATHALRRAHPARSAAAPPPLWLLASVIGLLGGFAGAAVVDVALAYFIITCIAAAPFAFIVAQRILILLVHIACPSPHLGNSAVPRGSPEAIGMADLPVYSVLVPLYDEAEILPDLVDALIRLDYPAAKLDVILILEETDTATRLAADAAGLPGFIRVVCVPASGPRTKPKALNYALELARGSFVTIFDAEDIPEPRQLRNALAAFTAAGPEVACLQARLNIYNRGDGWLTRQFALEYTALFDGILPALERLAIPIPLGGTSNHFRRATLTDAGGWDPFNATEDADLGIRLARGGGRIAILASTTWEEAPATLADWLPQRTRWLKGWMQTYMVHMRAPIALWADLGTWRFLGFQCLIFGFLLSALLHPFLYVIIAIELTRAMPFASGPTTVESVFWHLALFNLVAGYVVAMALAAITALRRGWPGLALSVIWMPAYWLLSSLAAYRALWQLFAAPHLWEKTRHRRRDGYPPLPD